MRRPDWLKTFTNVTEYKQPVKLVRKSGKVPCSIEGVYYKCGPGVFKSHGVQVAHPFDGDGVVTAYRFSGGTVTYQARIVETHHWIDEKQKGRRAYWGAFGTPPNMQPLKNPANTNVVLWGGVLIVFCESGAPYVMDPLTLETMGTLAPFQDGCPLTIKHRQLDSLLRRMHVLGDAVGAHPKIIDDMLVFYTLSYGKQTVVTFYEMDSNLTICKTTSYTVDGFLYLHDFVVTSTHYIIFQHPLELKLGKAHTGIVNCLSNKTNGEAGRVHAISRVNNDHNVAAIGNGFITHHAYTHCLDGIEGVEGVDIYSVTYPELINFKQMNLIKKSCLMRTRFLFKNDFAEQTVALSNSIEFPSPFPSVNGGTFATTGSANVQQCLVRLPSSQQRDSHTATQQINLEDLDDLDMWDAGPNAFIGEPVADGQGHVMSVIHDVTSPRSVLAIFNELEISNGPIAELWLPEHVNTSLHGGFYAC